MNPFTDPAGPLQISLSDYGAELRRLLEIHKQAETLLTHFAGNAESRQDATDALRLLWDNPPALLGEKHPRLIANLQAEVQNYDAAVQAKYASAQDAQRAEEAAKQSHRDAEAALDAEAARLRKLLDRVPVAV